jgi:hypothetical protein
LWAIEAIVGATGWIGNGWDKCRVLFVVMAEKAGGHSSISTQRNYLFQ